MLKVWLGAVAAAGVLAGAAPADDAGGSVDLFAGGSLAGWVQRGGKAAYRVENGEVVGTSAPNTPNSFLCTEKEYADFVLELEVKTHPKLNSGVQVRSRYAGPGETVESAGKRVKGPRVFGYQVEVDPSDRAWTGGVYDEGRRLWLADLKANEPARRAYKPADWNRLRIEFKGDHLRTWVNGVPAADLRDAADASGFLALQVHGVGKTEEPLEVRWRHVRLKELK